MLFWPLHIDAGSWDMFNVPVGLLVSAAQSHHGNCEIPYGKSDWDLTLNSAYIPQAMWNSFHQCWYKKIGHFQRNFIHSNDSPNDILLFLIAWTIFAHARHMECNKWSVVCLQLEAVWPSVSRWGAVVQNALLDQFFLENYIFFCPKRFMFLTQDYSFAKLYYYIIMLSLCRENHAQV